MSGDERDHYLVAPNLTRAGLTRAVESMDETGQRGTISVVEERPLTIFLNGQEIVTAMTIGDYPEYLALGFLRNQGMLTPGETVEAVDFDEPAVLTEETADAGLPEECDAAEYRGFIGQNIAAVTVPTGPMLRAYGETDIITQDYLPQRTNIVYNAEGTILRVTCG